MESNTESTKDKFTFSPLSMGRISGSLPESEHEYYLNKQRRRSTIHSYNLTSYHSLSHDANTIKAVRNMSQAKALKNVIVVGMAFMFIFTAFISIQGLQSTMNHEGGIGVASLSCIYIATIISCMFSPFIIRKLTTKWTMVVSFVFFTGYFAGNFHPQHYMLLPLGVILGLLAGPLWSAQATSITTIALAYAEHDAIADQDIVINKFMGIFCGVFRTSNIWGNLITTLVLSQNQTLVSTTAPFANMTSSNGTCGANFCPIQGDLDDTSMYVLESITTIPESTKIMLLSIYLGCGVMGIVIVISLLDCGKESTSGIDNLTTKELFLATLQMFKDSRCQLLMLMVIFVGLEQGFMLGDFTKVSTCNDGRE